MSVCVCSCEWSKLLMRSLSVFCGCGWRYLSYVQYVVNLNLNLLQLLTCGLCWLVWTQRSVSVFTCASRLFNCTIVPIQYKLSSIQARQGNQCMANSAVIEWNIVCRWSSVAPWHTKLIAAHCSSFMQIISRALFATAITYMKTWTNLFMDVWHH